MRLEPAQEMPAASWLGRQLGDERRFWRWTAVVLGVCALCKGLRLPGGWALTQSQVDYSHGFVKRGLQGTLFDALHIHGHRALTLIFFAELLLLLAAMIALVRRVGLEERFGSMALAALFASSYAVTFLADIIGYTDILVCLAAVGLLGVRVPGRRSAVGLAVVPVALLVHENFLLLFFPAVLLSFALDAARERERKASRRALLLGACLALIAVAVTLSTSLRANLSPAEMVAFQNEVGARVDFPVYGEVFRTLSRSIGWSVHDMIRASGDVHWRSQMVTSLTVLLPTVLLLAHFARRLLRAAEPELAPWARRWLGVGTVLAMASPLAMHFVGWDAARWNAMAATAVFLVFLSLCARLPGGAVPLRAAERNAIVLVLALNMASGYGLFDGRTVTPFPFFPTLLAHLRG